LRLQGLLELDWGSIPECGVQPLAVIDILYKAANALASRRQILILL